MSSRFKLFGIEAKLKDFHAAGLLEKLSQREKDALYIYAVLKHDAACNGHTYISIKSLMEHKEWQQLKHEVVNWLSSLQLLSTNEVICEERFNSERNIFLYHNWKAEVDIAKGLHEVLKRGMTAQESWQMDFSRSEMHGKKKQFQALMEINNDKPVSHLVSCAKRKVFSTACQI